MKTENNNKDIVESTMVTTEMLSELPKYIEEIPVTISTTNELEINEINLNDYQSSLYVLLNKYASNHNRLTK